jgi:hypothetical protein
MDIFLYNATNGQLIKKQVVPAMSQIGIPSPNLIKLEQDAAEIASHARSQHCPCLAE